jgi:predicted transcriptional regulator
MTKRLEMAVEAARQLSPEEQDEIATVIMDIVAGGSDSSVYVLSDEEWATIKVSLDQADRGEFATEEEIEAVFAKYR